MNDNENILVSNKEDKLSELEKTVTFLVASYNKNLDFIFFIFYLSLYFIFFYLLPDLSRIILVSYFFAFLLQPFSRRIVRRSFIKGLLSPGIVAVIILSTVFLFLLGLLVGIVPSMISEYGEVFRELSIKFPEILEKISFKIEKLLGDHVDFPHEGISGFVLKYIDSLRSLISVDRILDILNAVWSTIFSGYSFGLALVNLALVPFFVFYFVEDWHPLNESLLKPISEKYKKKIKKNTPEIKRIIFEYIKGQLIVSACLCVLYSIALLIIGTPLAVPIGLLSGILSLIPYFGLFVGMVSATLMQFTLDQSLNSMLLPIFGFIFVQIIEANIITPKVIGESTGLHPGLILAVLIVGGSLFGLIGIVLAVPITAILNYFLSDKALTNKH